MKLAAILMMLTIAPALAADPETGTVFGTVVLPEGGPAKQANIMIDRTNLATQTDEQGRFSLAGVPLGAQTLRIFAVSHEAGKRVILVQTGDNALSEIKTGPRKGLAPAFVQRAAAQDTLGMDALRIEIVLRDSEPKVFDPIQFSVRIHNRTKQPLLLMRLRANPDEGPNAEFSVSAPFEAFRMTQDKRKADEGDGFVEVKPGDWFDPYGGAPLTGVPSRPGTFTATFKYSTRQLGLFSGGANPDSLRAHLAQVPLVDVTGNRTFKVSY